MSRYSRCQIHKLLVEKKRIRGRFQFTFKKAEILFSGVIVTKLSRFKASVRISNQDTLEKSFGSLALGLVKQLKTSLDRSRKVHCRICHHQGIARLDHENFKAFFQRVFLELIIPGDEIFAFWHEKVKSVTNSLFSTMMVYYMNNDISFFSTKDSIIMRRLILRHFSMIMP